MSIAEQVGKYLEEQNLKPEYLLKEEGAEPHGFLLPLTISNLGITVRLVVTFDTNNAHFRCFGIGRVDEDKKDVIFALLNDLNRYYRWTQIFVETDRGIVLEADQYFTDETAVEITYQTFLTVIQICTDVYPKLMASLWGDK